MKKSGSKKAGNHPAGEGSLVESLLAAISQNAKPATGKSADKAAVQAAAKAAQAVVSAKAALTGGAKRTVKSTLAEPPGKPDAGKTAKESASSGNATKQSTTGEKAGKRLKASGRKGEWFLMPVSFGGGQATAQVPLPLSPSQAGSSGIQSPGQFAMHHDGANNGALAHNAAKHNQTGLTIIDLRQSGQNKGSTPTSQPNHGQQSGNVRLFQLADVGANAPVRSGGQVVTARPAGAALPNQNFATLTDQIVKQTGILLRSDNSGEIRLFLKPEHLGSLRIKIDMNNNNLTGRILVQNHEALKLIQQNLESLYRALRDSGFTATALNVSVGGREGGERDRERSSPLPNMRTIVGVKGFDSQTPILETAGGRYSLVNLVI